MVVQELIWEHKPEDVRFEDVRFQQAPLDLQQS